MTNLHDLFINHMSHPDPTWWSSCLCGWESPKMRSGSAAQGQGQIHLDMVQPGITIDPPDDEGEQAYIPDLRRIAVALERIADHLEGLDAT